MIKIFSNKFNETVQDLYTENKTFLDKLDLNKWKDSLCSWIVTLNININVVFFPKLIHCNCY